MKRDTKYPWYVIDVIIFLAINIAIFYFFEPAVRIALLDLNWTVVILLAMGVYRLTDIITQESVTEFMRAPFMEKRVIDGKETYEYYETGIRGFFGILFSCNACMGVWVSMIIFYLFVFFPVFTLAFMLIMALTFFERFFSKIYNFLERRG